jgi:hypothetical protein
MLKVNGQLVQGLEGGDQTLGSKIIVSPADFQVMTGASVGNNQQSILKELDPPPNDSTSPIHGDNNHDEISKLLVHRLKRLAGL